MQNAPSVAYPVGRFVWEQRWLAMAAGLGGLVWALWLSERLWSNHAPVRGLWGAFLLWLGVWLVWWWRSRQAERCSVIGELVWVSEALHVGWYLECGAQRVPVLPWVAVDGGHWVWLRLVPKHGPHLWVWALRQDDPEQWLALRRALQPGRSSGSTPRV